MVHVGFFCRGTFFVCTGRLSSNPFAWNRRAHILFIDQPRYVGYSTGSGPFVLSSKDAAADLVQFIRGGEIVAKELGSVVRKNMGRP